MVIVGYIWEILKVVLTPVFICFLFFLLYSFLLLLLASKNGLEQTSRLCSEFSDEHINEKLPNNKINNLKYYKSFFIPFLILNLYVFILIVHNAMIFLNREVLGRTDVLIMFVLFFFYRYTYRAIAKEYDIKKHKDKSPVFTISYVYFNDSLKVMSSAFILLNFVLLLYPPIIQIIPNGILINLVNFRK